MQTMEAEDNVCVWVVGCEFTAEVWAVVSVLCRRWSHLVLMVDAADDGDVCGVRRALTIRGANEVRFCKSGIDPSQALHPGQIQPGPCSLSKFPFPDTLIVVESSDTTIDFIQI